MRVGRETTQKRQRKREIVCRDRERDKERMDKKQRESRRKPFYYHA